MFKQPYTQLQLTRIRVEFALYWDLNPLLRKLSVLEPAVVCPLEPGSGISTTSFNKTRTNCPHEAKIKNVQKGQGKADKQLAKQTVRNYYQSRPELFPYHFFAKYIIFFLTSPLLSAFSYFRIIFSLKLLFIKVCFINNRLRDALKKRLTEMFV